MKVFNKDDEFENEYIKIKAERTYCSVWRSYKGKYEGGRLLVPPLPPILNRVKSVRISLSIFMEEMITIKCAMVSPIVVFFRGENERALNRKIFQ